MPKFIFRAWATCDSIEEQKNLYQQNITFLGLTREELKMETQPLIFKLPLG